jgi:hypothetical protein
MTLSLADNEGRCETFSIHLTLVWSCKRPRFSRKSAEPLFAVFYDIYLNIVVFLNKHSSDCQPVAAVVAHTTKNLDAVAVVETFTKPPDKSNRGAFHQIQRTDRLVGNGVGIPGAYLGNRKDFHRF